MDRKVLEAWRELEGAHAMARAAWVELYLKAWLDREDDLTAAWLDAIDRESDAMHVYIKALDAMRRQKHI